MRRRQALSWLTGAGALGLGTTLASPAAARGPHLDAAAVAAGNAAVLAGLGHPGQAAQTGQAGQVARPGPSLRRWRWIVVHHTATEFATLPGIDRYHRTHFGDPLGAEYHFVINNGKKDGVHRPLGLIEVARWRHQEPAWHLFKPHNAPESIAICLIGNFEKRAVPSEMLAALTGLTRALMQLCDIPREHVSTHRVVDEKMTQCPGKLFPRDEFLRGL